MQRRAETKVPGGKLLRLDADVESAIISARITGDFFLHPEEAIERIEEALVGICSSMGRDEILRRIQSICDIHHITLLGLDCDALTDLVMEVLA